MPALSAKPTEPMCGIDFMIPISTAHIYLRLDTCVGTNRDWLLSIEVARDGKKVPYEQLGWYYSASLDARFTYVDEANGTFSPPPFTSGTPFDALSLRLIPWSSSAQKAIPEPVEGWLVGKHLEVKDSEPSFPMSVVVPFELRTRGSRE